MAEYHLSPAAASDLESIFDFTVQNWDVDQAASYIALLETACEQLAQSPQIAPACDHIRRGYRRRHVGRHIIYFQIADYGIAVVRILHDRMDMRRHL